MSKYHTISIKIPDEAHEKYAEFLRRIRYIQPDDIKIRHRIDMRMQLWEWYVYEDICKLGYNGFLKERRKPENWKDSLPVKFYFDAGSELYNKCKDGV